MTNARRHLSALLLASTLAACGSSSNEPPSSRDGATQGDADSGADLLAADAAFEPPPGTQLLLPRGVLVGDGRNSCSSSGTGDTWCGVVVPAQTIGRYELWVFDATSVVTGEDLRCDGTDSYCLRLSRNAYGADPASVINYAFQGDTFFYRAGDDAGDAAAFNAPVWIWRPGWASGRELVAGSPSACEGQGDLDVAVCLRNVDDADGTWEEITAGPTGTAEDGPLPVLDKVLLHSATTPPGVDVETQVGFSPDGADVAWSVGDATTGVQTLKVQKLGDATTRLTVATGVSYWRISNDGAAWLWLTSYTDDGIMPSGTLVTAPFPAGAGVSTLAMDVAEYDLVGDKGMLFRADVADQVGELRFMPDRAAPATSTLVDQGVRFTVARSADASTIVYSKTNTGVGADLFAWSASLSAPCTLTEIPAANSSTALLMAGNAAVVWAQTDVKSQLLSGAVTALASCQTKPFGSGLVSWASLGDDRLLYVDGAALGAAAGTLRVARVGADGLTGAGIPLQQGVGVVLAPLPPNAVLYTLANGAASDGLYLYAGALLEP
ncbi:MAG TPA: hypothetical protein VHL80_04790 [Polyangia bacterium]|nr:hypothetical protein [Polyangia bacterium]